MSKAFVTEDGGGEDGDDPPDQTVPADIKNYMTPAGFAALQDELRRLERDERPKVVETVSWAAGNGDRSENGDYLYGKKRLREIDRRIRYLLKRLDSAEVVDPRRQQGLDRVFFGATVSCLRGDGTEQTFTLVGPDEADAASGKINWLSPLARVLMKAREGDVVVLRSAAGAEEIELLSLSYG